MLIIEADKPRKSVYYCYGVLLIRDLKKRLSFEDDWVKSIVYWGESSYTLSSRQVNDKRWMFLVRYANGSLNDQTGDYNQVR